MDRVNELLQGIQPVTQAVVGASVLLSVISWIGGSVELNGSVASGLWTHLGASGFVLPPSMHVWALLTAGLFEYSFLRMLVTVAIVGAACKYFEGVWGSIELAKFVVIVNVTSALVSVIFQVFIYALTFDTSILYESYVNGHIALILAFTAALKQLIPEQVLFSLEPVRLRAKDVPALAVSLALLATILTGHFLLAVFSLTGFYSGWAYLRFFQVRDGLKGDRSETFAFAMFFPEPLQPLAKTASTVVFRFLVLLRMCERVEPRTQTEIEMEEAIHVRKDAPSMLGTDTADAERRRQKALTALESRLAVPQPQTRFATPKVAGATSSSSAVASSVPTAAANSGVGTPVSTTVLLVAAPDGESDTHEETV